MREFITKKFKATFENLVFVFVYIYVIVNDYKIKHEDTTKELPLHNSAKRSLLFKIISSF